MSFAVFCRCAPPGVEQALSVGAPLDDFANRPDGLAVGAPYELSIKAILPTTHAAIGLSDNPTPRYTTLVLGGTLTQEVLRPPQCPKLGVCSNPAGCRTF